MVNSNIGTKDFQPKINRRKNYCPRRYFYNYGNTALLCLCRKYEECIVDLQKALEKGASDRVQHKLCDKLAGCYVILKKHDKVRMRILTPDKIS